MPSVAILIGNSDDKLSQSGWSHFIKDVEAALAEEGATFEFVGFSRPDVVYQNACYVVRLNEGNLPELKRTLAGLARKYGQDSICMFTGEALLITPPMADREFYVTDPLGNSRPVVLGNDFTLHGIRYTAETDRG